MHITVILVASALLIGGGDGEKPAPKCQDTSAINWFLPGEFKKAQQRAKAENRILMIKGIAFGVDTVGAQCATKGQW